MRATAARQDGTSRTGWVLVSLGLAVAAALGIHARVDALAPRPLAIDEFYFAQSIGWILDTGLPAIPSGGYYTRGVISQYLTAAVVAVFGPSDAAFRVVSLVFGLGTSALVYLYARGFVPRAMAAAVAAVVLVSSWQIEVSAFARMYAGFQFWTLAFLLLHHVAYVRGRWSLRYTPHVLFLVGMTSHSLAILLAPLLFSPFLIPERRSDLARTGRLRFAAASGAIAYLGFRFMERSPRDLGVTNLFPDGYTPGFGDRLRLPPDPVWTLGHGASLDVVVAAVPFALWLVWRLVGDRPWRPEAARTLWLGFCAMAAGLHQFALGLACLAVAAFRYRPSPPLALPRRDWLLVGTAAAVAAVWTGWAAATFEWTEPFRGGRIASFQPFFLAFPDFYAPTLALWAEYLPVLGAALLGAIALDLWRHGPDPLDRLLVRPSIVCLYVAVCFSVLSVLFPSLRYYVFVYPVALVAAAMAVLEAARWIARRLRRAEDWAVPAAAAFFVVGFLLTDDFHWRHLTDPSSMDGRYQLGEFERFHAFAGPWYPRDDYASPGRFLQANAPEGARVVILDQAPVSYYLDRDHAVYYRRGTHRFDAHSRERGTVDLFSNRRLLSTPEEVREYARGASTVWLVRSTPWNLLPEDEVWGDDVLDVERLHLSEDERLEVVRVRLRGD